MATPRPVSYRVASGGTIYGGRFAPGQTVNLVGANSSQAASSGVGAISFPMVGAPAWLAGQPLNKAFIIPNSAGAGGAAVWAYGGYGLDPEKAILYSALNGGHSDSYDNRVTSFDLSADAPSWVLRNAPTPAGQLIQNSPYYADGKPSSRHTYDFTFWVPQVNRLMQVGFRGGWPAAYTGGDVVGFNPDTNTWDPAGTWASTAGHASGAFDPTRGHFWTNGWQRFDATTNTYSTPISSHPIEMRFPVVYDPVRDQMFCLQWGDTFGSDPTLNASKWNANGTGSQVAVTFNDSPAYQQFLSEKFYDATHISIYHAMTYDSANDCFYWYNGRLAQAGHLYVIRPNSSTVWDMELFNWAPGSPVMPSAPEAGICGRLKYVPNLKGFIFCPTGDGDIYFVRTS